VAAGETLNEKDAKALDQAKKDFAANDGGTSILGLKAPLFALKNPGIVSIPIGFLAAILGALAFREKRAEEMFDEVYVRQNTGIGMAKAIDH
jgi:cation/acetate symporter